LLVATLLVVAGGCAHAGSSPSHFNRDGWSQAILDKEIDPSEVVYPFDSTPELEAWVRDTLRRYVNAGSKSQLEVLQNEMFGSDFEFTYDEELTLTAAEAFETRRGNCMSFTALFVAMGRSAGIPTFLMAVRRAPEVDRVDDLVVVNRHVVAAHRDAHEVSVYDFYVASATPFIHQFVIDDVLATAMYHNNMGGAAIRHGDLEGAFLHLGITTTLAPQWGPGWVNLGVARFRSDDASGALAAYQHALEVDPNNSSALTNIAYVYRSQGRTDEAQNALRAAAHRTTNPFTLVAMADVEMVRGNLDQAARYLRKAKRWFGTEPEVYDALARLARYRDDPPRAKKYAARAAKLRKREAEANG
jgi:Flp pilus assembly protein TadD